MKHTIAGNDYEFQEAMDKAKHILDNQVTHTPLSGQDFEFVKDLFNHHPTIKRHAEVKSISVSQKMDIDDKYYGEMWFKIKFINETNCEFINGSECVNNLFNGPQTSLL